MFFFFQKILSGIPSEGQTVWTNKISGLNWVQTIHKSYQQMTLVDKRVLKELASSKFAIYNSIPIHFICLHKRRSVSQLSGERNKILFIMDHPKFIVSNQKEESNRTYRIKK